MFSACMDIKIKHLNGLFDNILPLQSGVGSDAPTSFPSSKFTLFIFYHFFIYLASIFLIPSKSKISRRENSSKFISAVSALHTLKHSQSQIGAQTKVPKCTVTRILQGYSTHHKPFGREKRIGRPPKLNERAKRQLFLMTI